jgi:hypothetical protein
MLKPALNIIDAIRDAISNSIPSTANLSAIGDTDPNDQTSSSADRCSSDWYRTTQPDGRSLRSSAFAASAVTSLLIFAIGFL